MYFPCVCILVLLQSQTINKKTKPLSAYFVFPDSSLFPASMCLCASGGSTSKPSTIEVTAEMEKEVMTLDDEETFGNFYKTISPTTLQDSPVILTEDDLSQIQSNTPTSVHSSVSTRTDGFKSFPESLILILCLIIHHYGKTR